MFNLFARKRRGQEKEIQDIKKKQRKVYQNAHEAIDEANKVLSNGFAIKVYKAQHGGKHAHS